MNAILACANSLRGLSSIQESLHSAQANAQTLSRGYNELSEKHSHTIEELKLVKEEVESWKAKYEEAEAARAAAVKAKEVAEEEASRRMAALTVMCYQFKQVLDLLRSEARDTREQAVKDFLQSQSYKVALATAQASEFTEGFEHCIDLLLDLGRLSENYNEDGRISAMLNSDGTPRLLAEIAASNEELEEEEFWHLVSTIPRSSSIPRPRYPGWFPRVLRGIDVTPPGSDRDYFPNNRLFHVFEGPVAWTPRSTEQDTEYQAMLRAREEAGLSNVLRLGDPGDGSVLPPTPRRGDQTTLTAAENPQNEDHNPSEA